MKHNMLYATLKNWTITYLIILIKIYLQFGIKIIMQILLMYIIMYYVTNVFM